MIDREAPLSSAPMREAAGLSTVPLLIATEPPLSRSDNDNDDNEREFIQRVV